MNAPIPLTLMELGNFSSEELPDNKLLIFFIAIALLCGSVAFIMILCERPRRRLAMAIDAIKTHNYQQAHDLLIIASSYSYPDNKLCLAYTCAKLGNKQETLETLLQITDQPSEEYSHIIHYLEGHNDTVQENAFYIQQAESLYKESLHHSDPIEQNADECTGDTNARAQELHRDKHQKAILCALNECMIALLTPPKKPQAVEAVEAVKEKSSTSPADKTPFPWLEAIRYSRRH